MRDLAEFLEDQCRGRRARCRSPVSRTCRLTVSAHAIRGGPDAHFAAFSELDRVGDEVAQNLRHLASSVSSGGTSVGSSNTSATASPTSSGRNMPRSAPNSDAAVNSRRRHHRLARFHLGEIQQIVDQLSQVLRSLADEADLCLLLRRQLAVTARQQQPRQRQDRVERRAKFVAHVREEFRFQLVRAAQMIGALIELGIQRDDAAIGVLQFLIELLRAPPGAIAARPSAAGSAGSVWRDFLDGIAGSSRRQRIR